jgi:hypothetical protein
MSNQDLMKSMVHDMGPDIIKGLGLMARSLVSPVEPRAHGDAWWQRPGIGIQFQIEYRPGWDWDRDFNEFNRSMMDEEGGLKFNGPFPRPEEWVQFSKEVGVDYHQMEIKWHDGICYFDTKLTDWKTEEDYAARFAEASRKAGIPFLYYYSNIFDHNPQFDSIQPDKQTASFMGIPGSDVYDEYMRGQYREIMGQYHPDGMWLDWYWKDRTTRSSIEFFRTNYPDTVLAFNISSVFISSHSQLDFTSGETHALDHNFFKITRGEESDLFVFSSAWKWSAVYRRIMSNPWELITPAGKAWQDPSLRDNPYDLPRMAACIMACGGKLCIGVTSLMDGSVNPEQVKQLKILGDWYKPRRALFAEAVPLKYRRRGPPGVRVSPSSVKAIVCRRGDDLLLHLVNMDGATRPIGLALAGSLWDRVTSAYLEPAGKELEIKKSEDGLMAMIPSEDVDRVDTILRLELF